MSKALVIIKSMGIGDLSILISSIHAISKKIDKSVWRMPWLSMAMKDVTSCDKFRGGANNFRSENFRMGQPD